MISKIQEVKSGIQYGAILNKSKKVLEAENLKIKQQLITIGFFSYQNNFDKNTDLKTNADEEILKNLKI